MRREIAAWASAMLVACAHAPQVGEIGDDAVLRNAMVACGGGFSSTAMQQLHASLDAAVKSGSARTEAARSITARALELAPEATRHEIFKAYTECLEKHARVTVSARFTGTVSYADGNPVTEALVRVEGYGLSDKTDERGRFEITLPAGSSDSLSVVIILDDRREERRIPPGENVPIRVRWTSPPPDDLSIEVGDSTFLDLSQRQGDWLNLTAWLRASGMRFGTLEQPFAANNPRARRVRVLILPLPHQEPLSPVRIAAVHSWVERGGGLLFLGYYAADRHHGTNPSDLTRAWGVEFDQNVLLPPQIGNCSRQHVFRWDDSFAVRIQVAQPKRHAILTGVSELAVVSSASIRILPNAVPQEIVVAAPANTHVCRARATGCSPNGLACAVEWEPDGTRAEPVLAAFRHGAGRVVVVGTWKLLNPNVADNRVLLRNVIEWLQGTLGP